MLPHACWLPVPGCGFALPLPCLPVTAVRPRCVCACSCNTWWGMQVGVPSRQSVRACRRPGRPAGSRTHSTGTWGSYTDKTRPPTCHRPPPPPFTQSSSSAQNQWAKGGDKRRWGGPEPGGQHNAERDPQHACRPDLVHRLPAAAAAAAAAGVQRRTATNSRQGKTCLQQPTNPLSAACGAGFFAVVEHHRRLVLQWRLAVSDCGGSITMGNGMGNGDPVTCRSRRAHSRRPPAVSP